MSTHELVGTLIVVAMVGLLCYDIIFTQPRQRARRAARTARLRRQLESLRERQEAKT
ncbi:MAG: hypothetical protein KC503_47225 [Myxococcales bacterium]|nr:hypothetical protein [Myxococcales bacterium]